MDQKTDNYSRKSLQGKKLLGTGEDADDSSSSGLNIHDKRKKIHRDIERQRRQEMANLHASLRSLLPVEYIKGKRSMSDHLGEAANYIKHKEKNIKELESRRNELKNNTSNLQYGQERSSSSTRDVEIYPRFGGLEVVIKASYTTTHDETVISRVLNAMLEQGLDVVSYVSSHVNDKFFLNIQSEVKEVTSVDVSQLQQRLTHLLCSKDF